jgi:regulator of protease activity HflC (stomatin/prohibitin superfamily)
MDEPMNAATAVEESGLSNFRRHMGRQFSAYRDELQVLGFVLVALIVFLLPLIVHTVPAGHVAVHWKRFGGGTDLTDMYPEGTRFILPWDLLLAYDTRLQIMEKQVEVLSSDGLQMTMDVACRFRLLPEAAAEVHKYVGVGYLENLIAHTVSARARDVVAVYKPDEIYTEKRLAIQEEILESVRYDLHNRFKIEGKRQGAWFTVEDVLIKNIALPAGVQEAIVRKNSAFHEMEEFSFRIEREQKESERKRIEAIGIRNFQEIVSNGMSEAYLRWRGIEATLELARSPNAKVVVIGSGKSGLPLILNADAVKTEGLVEGVAAPAAPARLRQKVGAGETADQLPLAKDESPANSKGSKAKTGTGGEEKRMPPRAATDAAKPEAHPATEQGKVEAAATKEKDGWWANMTRWLGLAQGQ